MKLKIRKPDDMHCHLRQGKLLNSVIEFTSMQFKRAVIMPNTDPPILTEEQAFFYEGSIRSCSHNTGFEPLMTIQINGDTTPAIVVKAKKAGVIAGKVYPQGVTTNSQNGVTNFKLIYPELEKMQEIGMLLLIHGEDPWSKATCLDRENLFLPTLFQIASDFPRLKIVMEHITTENAVEFITSLPKNVGATITAHHLCLTIDDVVGGLIQPHNFCKPIAKLPADRETLIAAATSGNPKFFFGSDSAPHLKEKKECSHGCAGCFTAPVALPLLAQIFEEHDALDKLEAFVSHFGADFYGLARNKETIELEKANWLVPPHCNGIVPFMADRYLNWKIAE